MIFEDGNTRFEQLSNLFQENTNIEKCNNLQTIISFNYKNNIEKRVSELEDEGF